jgi:hypothetical protein
VTPVTNESVPAQYGNWRLIGYADARLAKRAIVKCVHCLSVREINAEALLGGQIVPCVTCEPPARPSERRGGEFASSVADTESRSARKRHRGMDG